MSFAFLLSLSLLITLWNLHEIKSETSTFEGSNEERDFKKSVRVKILKTVEGTNFIGVVKVHSVQIQIEMDFNTKILISRDLLVESMPCTPS